MCGADPERSLNNAEYAASLMAPDVVDPPTSGRSQGLGGVRSRLFAVLLIRCRCKVSGPPLHHLPPSRQPFRRIVDGTDALIAVGKLDLDPIPVPLVLVEGGRSRRSEA